MAAIGATVNDRRFRTSARISREPMICVFANAAMRRKGSAKQDFPPTRGTALNYRNSRKKLWNLSSRPCLMLDRYEYSTGCILRARRFLIPRPRSEVNETRRKKKKKMQIRCAPRGKCVCVAPQLSSFQCECGVIRPSKADVDTQCALQADKNI